MENITYCPLLTLEGQILFHQIIQKGEDGAEVTALPARLMKKLIQKGEKILFSVAASQTADTLSEFIDMAAKCYAEIGIVGTPEVPFPYQPLACMVARAVAY